MKSFYARKETQGGHDHAANVIPNGIEFSPLVLLTAVSHQLKIAGMV